VLGIDTHVDGDDGRGSKVSLEKQSHEEIIEYMEYIGYRGDLQVQVRDEIRWC
jgi:hypothetical protein